MDLERHFDIIVTPDDVPPRVSSKTEIFRTAADRLGVNPHGIVVVEDATNGVAAAHEAGLPCVAEVRGVGLMLGIELTGGDASAVQAGCRRRGVIVRATGQKIVLSPPLVITEQQADRIAGARQKLSATMGPAPGPPCVCTSTESGCAAPPLSGGRRRPSQQHHHHDRRERHHRDLALHNRRHQAALLLGRQLADLFV